MNNKKGFTLIELLAVIIILAIIALIAVPVISNIINSGKKSVARSNALHYIKALEDNNGYASANQSGYTKITGNKNVKDIKIDVKRTKPEKGTISINSDGMVTYAKMVFNGYWVEYNGTDAKVTGKYTPGKVNITFINDDTVIETRQINEGSTIGSFPNITLEENQELIGWYLDSEFNTVAETTTQVDDDISVYVKITRTCGQFATDSWEKISKNSYPVGCEKEVEIDMDDDETPESYTVRVANNTRPEECETDGFSQTACGFVIEFADVVSTHNINTKATSAGGWKNSEMISYVNEDFYNKLPSDLKNVIIPTYPIVSGGGVDTSEDVTESDTGINKIYLLSINEAKYNISGDAKANYTRTLDYYKINNKNSALIKKDVSGSPIRWWTRTAYSGYDFIFFQITDTGSYGNSTSRLVIGVAPAFRLRAN